jgi:DNA polymerase-3 subunit alpha
LPPDIQCSNGKFKLENGSIRFGLLATKTVGERVSETIEQARAEGGKFKNWDDFLQRVDLKSINKLAMESLAKAGFFDCFGDNKAKIRAQIIKSVENSIDKAEKVKAQKASAQGMLFGMAKEFEEKSALLDADPLEENTMFDYEKEVLGFYLSGHPLSSIKKDLMRYSDFSLNNIPKIEEGQDFFDKNIASTRLAGAISSINIAMSKKKEEYAKFKIEDMDGSISAIMFPKTFSKYREILKPNLRAVVKGKLGGSQEKPEFAVDRIMSLEEAKVLEKPKEIKLYIKISSARYDDDLGEELKNIFSRYEGLSAVFLDITDPLHGKFIIDTKYSVNCTDDFEKDIEEAIGGDNIVNFR